MKGGARQGAGRKKKAVAKKTAMQKKKFQAMDDAPRPSVGAEERLNKHKSYMKIQKGEDSRELIPESVAPPTNKPSKTRINTGII
jgi:hypothetical protein